MPSAVTLLKLDGKISFGPWFRERRVETRGIDSITHVPIGKKLTLIAKRGRASQRLDALFTSWKVVAELLSKSPSKVMRENFTFFESSPDALMVPSFFCTHSVVTFNDWPALVVGFEGKDETDPKRRSQVNIYYSTFLEMVKREVVLGKYSDKQALAN